MRLSSFKILIITTAISLIGLFYADKLIIEVAPEKSKPSITISYLWANAGSRTMDLELTSLIETSISQIEGVYQMESYSGQNQGYVKVDLKDNYDINNIRLEISSKLRSIKNKLPEASSLPQINVNQKNFFDKSQALAVYSITSNLNNTDFNKILTQKLQPKINAIEGISKVEISGIKEDYYEITYDKDLCQNLNISTTDIRSALRNFFDYSQLGQINLNENVISVNFGNQFEISRILEIPVKHTKTKVFSIGDIAQIKLREKEPVRILRVNGSKSIDLIIFPKETINSLSLATQLESTINILNEESDGLYYIQQTFNGAKAIDEEIKNVYLRTFTSVCVLLLSILFFSRDRNFIIIIISSIVLTLSTSLLFFNVFDISLNILSLAALTISIGLLIDNCIITIDHYQKFKNKKFFLPILAATLTTISTLLVSLVFDLDLDNSLFDFVLVLIITLFISLIQSYFVIPALFDLLKVSVKQQTSTLYINSVINSLIDYYEPFLKVILSGRWFFVLVLFFTFGTPLFLLPKSLEGNSKFTDIYNKVLGGEYYLSNIRPYIDTYSGGALRLFVTYAQGSTAQVEQKSELVVSAQLERKVDIKVLDEIMKVMESETNNYLESIDYYETNVNVNGFGELKIVFKEEVFEHSNVPLLLKQKFIEKVLSYEGIQWNIYGVGDVFMTGSLVEQTNFTLKIKGFDYDQLVENINLIKNDLQANPRIKKVIVKSNLRYEKENGLDLKLNLKANALKKNGLEKSDVLNEVAAIWSKPSYDNYQLQNENHVFRIIPDNFKSVDKWGLLNSSIDISDKKTLLKDVISISEFSTPNDIVKENKNYINYLSFEYSGNYGIGEDLINSKILEYNINLPYGFEISNTSAKKSEEDHKFVLVILLLILIIYIVCSILFENIRQPLAVIGILPVTYLGVFITYYVFDIGLNGGTLACFVLLSGLTVNSSIYIIDTYNHFNSIGSKSEEGKFFSYLCTLRQKTYPIFLTLISTILGFLPFVIKGTNNEFWFSLGMGVIGGLLFSVIGLIVYLPILILKKNYE